MSGLAQGIPLLQLDQVGLDINVAQLGELGDGQVQGLGAFAGGIQTLMLSVQGEALQGALKAERGTTELKSVLLDGNKITFTLAVEGPRGTFQLIYNGEVDGDTMTGTMEGPGGRFTINWKATRAT